MSAKTFNGVTIATGTGTLTMGNNSLDIGTGGTLGSAAFTNSNAYEVPLTFSTGLTRNTNTVTNNLSTGIAGGQAVIGGTGVTDILSLKGTTGNGTLTAPSIQALVGNNGGTVALTILNNGNIGIGTTNPGASLEINGQVKITGGSPGASKYLMSDASGLASWNTITLGGLGGIGGMGTQNYISKWDSTGTGLTNSTIFDNGQVGIGTTAPAGLLQVSGIAAGNATAIFNTANSTNDLLTASASGTPKFTIANNGNIAATGTLTGLTGLTSSGTITFSGLNVSSF